MHINTIWVLAVLAAAFANPASAPVNLVDLAWTIKSGEWIVNHGRLLVVDPFTAAPPAVPQLDTQWLAQLIYYVLFHIGGFDVVSVGTAVAVATTFALVLAACRTTGAGVRVSCVCTLAALVLALTNIDSRPQTLAYPLFGLFVLALTRAAQGRLPTWVWCVFPPAMAVWANIHGSFVLGLVLLALGAVGAATTSYSVSAARPYAVTLVACILAACATPYGVGSLGYVGGMGSNPVIRESVTEWSATSVASGPGNLGLLFFLSLLAVGAVVLWSSTRPTVGEWLTLAIFVGLGLAAVRGVVWWGLVAAPIVARLVSATAVNRQTRAPRTPTRGARILNTCIGLGIVGFMVWSLPWFKSSNPLLQSPSRGRIAAETPVAVADYLGEHRCPDGLFNHVNWGGYLEWTLWPDQKPFIDTRIELHPTAVWDDYESVVDARAGWEDILERYAINCLILSKQEQDTLIQAAHRSPLWKPVYEDQQALVLVRANPA